jgi:hypothetical protein
VVRSPNLSQDEAVGTSELHFAGHRLRPQQRVAARERPDLVR